MSRGRGADFSPENNICRRDKGPNLVRLASIAIDQRTNYLRIHPVIIASRHTRIFHFFSFLLLFLFFTVARQSFDEK